MKLEFPIRILRILFPLFLNILLYIIGYEPNWDENVIEIVCKHILNNPKKHDDMLCTALDWNSSGTIIASRYIY